MSIKYIKFQKELGLTKDIEDIIPHQLFFTLGLCGGRSIIIVIEAIKKIVASRNSNFQAIMVDERLVPFDHIDSNYKIVNETFNKEDNFSNPTNIIPFNTQDISKGVSQYGDFLRNCNFSLDLVFLGVGEDGHVAGLFPGFDQIKETEDKVLIFDNSPKPPSSRMTLSMSILKKSKNIVLLFIGESKKDAFNMFQDEITSVYDCPAKFFKDSNNCYVITDLI